MTGSVFDDLPKEAVGLQLGRIVKDELRLCEAVRFTDGFSAVHTTLRRAALSGRVEIEGAIGDHLADVLGDDGGILATVALDARSYRSLKNHWMRCKLEPRP